MCVFVFFLCFPYAYNFLLLQAAASAADLSTTDDSMLDESMGRSKKAKLFGSYAHPDFRSLQSWNIHNRMTEPRGLQSWKLAAWIVILHPAAGRHGGWQLGW